MVLAIPPKRQLSAHHKKRTGAHHKRDKAYHKSYWPYIPMLVVVLVGLGANLLWTPATGGTLAYATNMNLNGLLSETNEKRSSAGADALVINQALMNAAQAKANDMAARNYWSHVTPDGKQPWWFVTSAGYNYLATGENLAYGFDNSGAAITGWMNSPGHKANLLNTSYRDVGFGIANSQDYQGHGQQTIVVAMYGKSANATIAAAPAATATTQQSTAAAASAANSPTATTATPTPTPAATAPSPTPSPQTANNNANSQLQLAPATVAGQAQTAAVTDSKSQPVPRLALVAADVPPYSIYLTTLVLAVFGAIFILRHMLFWHRAVVKGEAFVIKHWKADVLIIAIIVVGAILTRTGGFIQ